MGKTLSYTMTPEEYTNYVNDVMEAVEKGNKIVCNTGNNPSSEIYIKRIDRGMSKAKEAVKKKYILKHVEDFK